MFQFSAANPLLPPLDLYRPPFAVLGQGVDFGLAIRRIEIALFPDYQQIDINEPAEIILDA